MASSEVAITQKVSKRVTSLVVTREGSDIKVDYKIPEVMKSSDRNDRATGIELYMYINGTNNGAARFPNGYAPPVIWMPYSGNIPPSHYDVNYKNADGFHVVGMGTQESLTKPFDRRRYHPFKNNYVVTSISVAAYGNNTDNFAANRRGPAASTSIGMAVPNKPYISEMVIDDGGYAYSTIDADEGAPEREVYDTGYHIDRIDNFNTAYKAYKTIFPASGGWTYKTDQSFDTVDGDGHGVDISDFQSLTPGQYIQLRIQAFSRGLRGNSATTTRYRVFSCPKKGKINSINVTDLGSSGMIRILVAANQTSINPIDSVQLQVLHSTTASSIETAIEGNWSDVSGASDNGNTTGFTIPVRDYMPARGRHEWFRIASTHDTYTTYSDPVEAKQLFRDASTTTSDTVGIISLASTPEGDGIYVNLGWNDDPSEGTEVSWSEFADAWQSTNDPSVKYVTWYDPTPQPSTENYTHTARLTIYGLTEGADYYIKARRYRTEEDGSMSYGTYATPLEAQYPYKPVSKPTNVILTAPDFVEVGKDFNVTWTYVSGSTQNNWMLYYIDANDKRIPVASGSDATGSAKVTLDKIPKDADSMRLVLSMTTGSEWADSNEELVKFMGKPVVTGRILSPVTAQPLTVNLTSDTGDDSIVAKIYAKGVSMDMPEGPLEQLPGEVVWSGKFSPKWTANGENGDYISALTLPVNLEVYDLAYYTLSVTAVNNTSVLSSEPDISEFQVNWEHKAQAPKRSSIVLENQQNRSVQIKPVPPDHYSSVYDFVDIYRVTPESIELIADKVTYGSVVTDRYAPYSKIESLYYRLATRTVDGDVSYIDIPYAMKSYMLRFDWGLNDFLEVPYNLTQSDKYEKDFDQRVHLDGSVGGAWNAGVTRSATMSTDLIRLGEPLQQQKVRELAKYPGAVFVRTPNALAYEANVEVNKIDWSYDKLVMNVSFSIDAVDLTDEFRIQSSDIVLPTDVDRNAVVYASETLRWNETPPEAAETFELDHVPAELESVTTLVASSSDDYAERMEIPNTHDGSTVTFGTFSSELSTWLSERSGDEFLLIANYRY